jgi:hypothetical protein
MLLIRLQAVGLKVSTGYIDEAGSKAGLVFSKLIRQKYHRCHCPALSDLRSASPEGLTDKLKMVPQP